MPKRDYSNWSKDELIKELTRVEKRKKYGIVWEAKPEEVAELCKLKLPVLTEDTSKEIKSSQDEPVNILIEGDNYHALSVLNYTHKGKVDIIYIDPPYNTGAKDWKYNNDYVDVNDNWKHSKWLSFMEKRLKLAKSLLQRNGVLICTIDKNENAALALLLQEIFTDREIVGIVIIHNPAGVQGKNFSYTHEFAYFVYPKNGLFIEKTSRDKELVSPLRDWGGTSARKLAKNCFYPIIVKNEEIIGFGDVCSENFHPKLFNITQRDGSVHIYPIDKSGIERKWVYSRQSAEENINQLFVKRVKNEYVIMRKKEYFTYRTVWDDERYYANIYGSKLLNNILSTRFPYPKSLYAVEDCIKAVIHDKDNSIILDFFAGSGTTGHAVLELNSQDKGKRKFILCTNNEDNNDDGTKIATDVCYPRIKSVINGYVGIADKKKYDGIGGNLKYYKTDFVDAEATDRNKAKLVNKSTEMLCLKEDCFNQISNSRKYKTFTNNKGKLLGVIYDDDGIEPFIKEVKRVGRKFIVYVFSLDESAREEEFEPISDLVELKPIPAVILNVYKRIFR